MGDFKKTVEHKKNKLAGGIKEAVGKATGNEKLELKGKIQSTKADIKNAVNVGKVQEKIADIGEKAAGKINHAIDKNKKHKK